MYQFQSICNRNVNEKSERGCRHDLRTEILQALPPMSPPMPLIDIDDDVAEAALAVLDMAIDIELRVIDIVDVGEKLMLELILDFC